MLAKLQIKSRPLPAAACAPTKPPSALLSQVSQQRLEEVRKELADLQDKLQPLMLRYQQEKQRLEGIRQLQKKKEELLMKLQEAENRMDLAMVADIKWVLHLLLSVGHAPNASEHWPCLWLGGEWRCPWVSIMMSEQLHCAGTPVEERPGPDERHQACTASTLWPSLWPARCLSSCMVPVQQLVMCRPCWGTWIWCSSMQPALALACSTAPQARCLDPANPTCAGTAPLERWRRPSSASCRSSPKT